MGLFSKEKLHHLRTNVKDEPKHTIMFVDDEKGIRETISHLFSDKYDVIMAEDGQEALEILQSMANPGKIRVIISDHQMPRLTGLSLFKSSMSIIPNTVRIIITGYLDKVYTSDAIDKADIYKILSKPCDPPQLLQLVANAIETENSAPAKVS